MPVQMTVEKYRCEHCTKEYSSLEEAVSCEVGHEIIYVPIARTDLRALWNFLATGNPRYITRSLERTLRKYNKIVGRI